MTRKYILLLSIAFTFTGIAQEKEDFKVGLGLPIFTKSNSTVNISANPILSVEKPLSFPLFQENRFYFNPGLAYFRFYEDEQPKELGHGIFRDIKHSSFNTFVKAYLNINLNKVTNSYFYFGGIGGLHIATSSKGVLEVYQNGKEIHELFKTIDQSGNQFFTSSYYGFLLGFRPKSTTKSVVTPSFEMSFLPNFLFVKDKHENAIQLSVFLGISPKKKATQNE